MIHSCYAVRQTDPGGYLADEKTDTLSVERENGHGQHSQGQAYPTEWRLVTKVSGQTY